MSSADSIRPQLDMEDDLINYDEAIVDRKKLEVDIASAMSKGQVYTADEVAEKFGIEVVEAISLLNDADFLSMVTMFISANLTLLDTVVISELSRILKTGNTQEKFAAIDRIMKRKGIVKNGVEFNLHLEGMLDKLHEKQVGGSAKVTLEDDVTDLFPDERGAYGKR